LRERPFFCENGAAAIAGGRGRRTDVPILKSEVAFYPPDPFDLPDLPRGVAYLRCRQEKEVTRLRCRQSHPDAT